jgi:Fe2+ or Zn2+ uptake regulation protein
MVREPKPDAKLAAFMAKMMEEVGKDTDQILVDSIIGILKEAQGGKQTAKPTLAEISQRVDMPKTTVLRRLRQLADQGCLKRVGTRPSYWFPTSLLQKKKGAE